MSESQPAISFEGKKQSAVFSPGQGGGPGQPQAAIAPYLLEEAISRLVVKSRVLCQQALEARVEKDRQTAATKLTAELTQSLKAAVCVPLSQASPIPMQLQQLHYTPPADLPLDDVETQFDVELEQVKRLTKDA